MTLTVNTLPTTAFEEADDPAPVVTDRDPAIAAFAALLAQAYTHTPLFP